MAKRIKSAVDVARAEAEAAQAAFDKASAAFGSAFTLTALYGLAGSASRETAYDEANSMDADRSQERFSYLLDHLRRETAFADQKVNSWKARLDSDPADAFAWADGAMEAAGKASVLRRLVIIVTEKGLDLAIQWATEKAMDGARSPQHSTSTCSNSMAAYETAAWAEFATRGYRGF